LRKQTPGLRVRRVVERRISFVSPFFGTYEYLCCYEDKLLIPRRHLSFSIVPAIIIVNASMPTTPVDAIFNNAYAGTDS
jgi:hypothetical protein